MLCFFVCIFAEQTYRMTNNTLLSKIVAMAHLFSHKLLQETVKNVTIPEMEEKIAVLQSRVTAITTKSIYKKTESECEQAFNLDIFHKVL
jgi:uncharacterized small protein (DUF1192 family)